ncbi:MAG: hypothetical protein JNG85_13140 [Spirochaetaceae bacterium]|nr:hypothetical protein [Spirochaetaceae bacterium]
MSDQHAKNRNSASSHAAEAPAPAAGLVAAIRGASAEIRLTRLTALRSDFPEAAAREGGVELLLEESGAADLRRMAGEGGEAYYFSADSMTEAYALHLFRIEEKDPVRLVADTVRDDSRIYPRPTDVRVFADPPFSLPAREVAEVVARMEMRPDTADIKSGRASNGALYLYSDRFLEAAHAESLIEWIEVGQKENP